MNTSASSENKAGHKEVATAFDFYKMVSKPWLDMIDRTFAKSGNGGMEGSPAWPAPEVWKLWAPRRNGFMPGAAASKPEVRKLFSACLEQQQRCTGLTTASFTCALKMMETCRTGIQHRKDPSEILKTCREAAAEYGRTCTAFNDSQWAQFLQACGIGWTKEETNGAQETAKSGARPEAKV
ncbi:MAG: hypothetical protein NTV58_02825 [Deltaproteobacteria bacterium]|nr:hypothetical protein [Deltaproteobacteria bacterium]